MLLRVKFILIIIKLKNSLYLRFEKNDSDWQVEWNQRQDRVELVIKLIIQMLNVW